MFGRAAGYGQTEILQNHLFEFRLPQNRHFYIDLFYNRYTNNSIMWERINEWIECLRLTLPGSTHVSEMTILLNWGEVMTVESFLLLNLNADGRGLSWRRPWSPTSELAVLYCTVYYSRFVSPGLPNPPRLHILTHFPSRTTARPNNPLCADQQNIDPTRTCSRT